MRKLEPVHNTALLNATGAFRTSPISSLLVEARVPSLSQLIKVKNMKYWARLKKFPYKLIDEKVMSDDGRSGIGNSEYYHPKNYNCTHHSRKIPTRLVKI